MKAFSIETTRLVGSKYFVVANSMADAERIFAKVYSSLTIHSITLTSEYVLVQGIDDKESESDGKQ